MKLYLKDPKSGKDSVTLTAFIVGFAVCLAKLALSGMVIGGIEFSVFSGLDFSLAVGSLGAIYGYRKTTDNAASALAESKVKSSVVKRDVVGFGRGTPPVEGEGE